MPRTAMLCAPQSRRETTEHDEPRPPLPLPLPLLPLIASLRPLKNRLYPNFFPDGAHASPGPVIFKSKKQLLLAKVNPRS